MGYWFDRDYKQLWDSRKVLDTIDELGILDEDQKHQLTDVLLTEMKDEIEFDYLANEYVIEASRTIGCKEKKDMEMHALHGMVGEIGELHSLYQKVYQGHGFDIKHGKKELGDLLWFIAEYCVATELELADVMATNIQKLRKRYPDGFEEQRSLHRAEGDI